MNTETQISPLRIRQSLRSRMNPLRTLTPANLARDLDEFTNGYLRRPAWLFELIEKRDDRIPVAAGKRKQAVSRRDWEVKVLGEEDDRAMRHKEAVEYAFDNFISTDATREQNRKGFSNFLYQSMDSTGKGWSAHELIWHPGPEGLRVEARFVPLWWFTHETGRLEYLPSELDIRGMPLEHGEWIVTCCDVPLMVPSSILYIGKNLAQDDWLAFGEKFGIPGVIAKTNAAKGSPEWNELASAVETFVGDWTAVMGEDSRIELLEVKSSSAFPFGEFVDRADRAIFTLWRGGDLGSMSGSGAQKLALGSNIQRNEKETLELSDAAMLSDTINEQLVPWIVRFAIGDDIPLVKLVINVPQERDDETDMKVDRFLIEMGVETAKPDLRERYGRTKPSDDEDLVNPKRAKEAPKPPEKGIVEKEIEEEKAAEKQEFGNVAPGTETNTGGEVEAMLTQAMADAMGILPTMLAPVSRSISRIVTLLQADSGSEEDLLGEIEKLALEIPEFAGEMDDNDFIEIFEGVCGSAALNATRDRIKELAAIEGAA